MSFEMKTIALILFVIGTACAGIVFRIWEVRTISTPCKCNHQEAK